MGNVNSKECPWHDLLRAPGISLFPESTRGQLIRAMVIRVFTPRVGLTQNNISRVLLRLFALLSGLGDDALSISPK